MRKKTETENKLLDAILEGIRKTKGKNIRIIDLNTIHHTECGYFIVCHGTSSTHAASVAQSVEKTVKEDTGENAWHVEGYQNAIWILLDFGEIVVHVFQEHARHFYNLEGLWADAKITEADSDN